MLISELLTDCLIFLIEHLNNDYENKTANIDYVS
jgi:hypothetical protein